MTDVRGLGTAHFNPLLNEVGREGIDERRGPGCLSPLPLLTSFALRRMRGRGEGGRMSSAHRPLQPGFLSAGLTGGGAKGRRGRATGSLLRWGVWSPLGHASPPPVVLTTGPPGGGSLQALSGLKYCC